MTSVDQVVRQLLEEWQKRKSGALPPVDLRVNCSSCGRQIIGGARIEFGRSGLICESCFKKGT